MLSATGLLESGQNVDFCKTPVGEDTSVGLFVVLLSTSPRGPPKEFPHEIGIQVFTFLSVSCSDSCDSLRGDRVVLSSPVMCVEEGDDNDDDDDDATGIDIESCVQSDFRSSGHELWLCLSWLPLKSKYVDPSKLFAELGFTNESEDMCPNSKELLLFLCLGDSLACKLTVVGYTLLCKDM